MNRRNVRSWFVRRVIGLPLGNCTIEIRMCLALSWMVGTLGWNALHAPLTRKLIVRPGNIRRKQIRTLLLLRRSFPLNTLTGIKRWLFIHCITLSTEAKHTLRRILLSGWDLNPVIVGNGMRRWYRRGIRVEIVMNIASLIFKRRILLSPPIGHGRINICRKLRVIRLIPWTIVFMRIPMVTHVSTWSRLTIVLTYVSPPVTLPISHVLRNGTMCGTKGGKHDENSKRIHFTFFV